VDELAAGGIGSRTKEQATTLLDQIRIAYGSVNDMGEVAGHPAALERAMIEEVESANGIPAQTLVGMGERIFGTSSEQRDRPPGVGEDTEAVLRSLGLATKTI
jgi:crotonobetainyl-CoA:carnitine CoA-transferase CaiB-like acyl-CoA transferase